MATGADVLLMLCESVEYVAYGDDYDAIDWLGKSPVVTKAEFEAGFGQYDTWKIEQESIKATAKAAAEAKLAALGLTADDLKALGLGNN
jgi:hypothetical protein